jgi:hypothetical protein
MSWLGPYSIVFNNGQQMCLLAYNENQARLLASRQFPFPIALVVALQL